MRGDARIEIGGIARAHGIRGEVVIVTHDPDSDTLSKVETLYLDGKPRKVLGARAALSHGSRTWLVKLDGVVTRNDAEALKGKQIEVDREDLELDDEDVILGDLVGCKVVLQDGTPYGEVMGVETGMQDRLIIHDGEMEKLLPLVDVFVLNIDLEAATIIVDPPENLPEWKRV